jgi:PIN domain nuclease of toxin-antitoxin system
VILLDTHVLIFDALAPSRLSKRATRVIQQGTEDRSLAISDVSRGRARQAGIIEPPHSGSG